MLTSVRHSLLQLDLTEPGIGKVQLEPPLVGGVGSISRLTLPSLRSSVSAVGIHLRGSWPTGERGETYRSPVPGDALGLVGAVL